MSLSGREDVIGAAGALPPAIAVHSVISTSHCRDATDAGVLHGPFECRYVGAAAGRRRVTPVGYDVHEDACKSTAGSHVQECVKVMLMAVHAAVGQQSDQVKCLMIVPAPVHRNDDGWVLEEVTIQNALVDSREILIHNPTRTEVHMPDLGVAHLSSR